MSKKSSRAAANNRANQFNPEQQRLPLEPHRESA